MRQATTLGHLVAGERSPIILLVLLGGFGVLFAGIDIRLWSLVGQSSPAQTRTAIVETPVAAVALNHVAPPPVDPGVPHPSATAVAPKPAVDCPPLFPISFGLNRAVPLYDPDAMVALVTWLLAHPQSILIIDGHADTQGSAFGNLGLSHWRADEMAKRFIAARLPSARITRRAFGQYVPLVGTPGQSSKNRRVDLSVTGTADCPVLEIP